MVSKHRWKGSMNSFRSTHLDPQKEEHLKGVKIEIENKARRILKLIKSINQGNRENKMKKKSELIQHMEDYHKQYLSLYALYEDLRGEVRKKVNSKDDDSSSTSTSDSESHDSPNDSTREDVEIRNDIASEDLEDVVLKDKFTSTIETIDLDSQSSFEMSREESRENLKDLEVQDELSESTRRRAAMDEGKRLVQRKDDLEGQVSSLSLEIEALFVEKRETEERIDCTLNEAKELKSKNSELKAQILELQEKSKQKDDHFSLLTSTFKENEQHYKSRIEGLVKQANSFELEMNSLHTRKGELEQRCEEGSSQVEELKKRANFLQQELDTMSNQKGESELELENKSKEASNYLNQIENLNEKFTEVQGTMEEKEGLKLQVQELKTKNSELEGQILELQEKSKQKDDHFSVLTTTFEENEQHYKSRIEGLMKQANSFELEMNVLHTRKGELEQRCKEGSSQVEDLKKRVNFLQQELDTMSNQKGELELELENKSKEASNYLNQIENLNEKFTKLQGTMEEKEGLKLQVQDLELEVKSINTKKSDLEDKMVRIYEEAYQSRVEKEELQKKIPELQTDLSKKENELNKLKNDLDALQSEKNRLKLELETEKQNSVISISNMEKKNIELTKKLAEIREEHKQQSKSNFQMVERKIEEMAKEFRKQFEDNLRIMSRRIRVAEQLQAENKDCYSKMKEMYEQENKELKERFGKAEIGLKNVKELSLTVNDMLNSLDTVGLKFEECTANFLNRISKVSCELKFAKDWVRRKNKAAMHLKDDLNCLLSQMDEKEAEILVFRERVWKSENKVRELEKMNKHNEDGMLVIQEEKREAIRQLCVWIDYHRSRSDYYKKMLTEITPGYRRAS